MSDSTVNPARPGRILAFRNDRLGARLISLINALRLSRRYELPLAVYWIRATDIGHVFNDPKSFFEAGFVDRHFIDEAEWKSVRDDALRIGNLAADGIDRLRAALAEGRDVLVDAAFGLTVLGQETTEEVRTQISELLADFPFADALRPSMAEIAATVTGGTAYHIRRGDLISFPRAMHRSWPKKYVPDEIYMVHIEREIAAGARPIVFSDHPETVQRFKAAYPQLIAAAELFDVSHLSPGQRDLMELYAMSRCAKIIAPGQSAFSSTAAELGGAVKIEIGEDLSSDAHRDALERLSTRLADPARGDVVSGAGDLGQSFPHVIEHLTASGRRAEAIASLDAQIRAGLNISFLYPSQLGQQLAEEDYAGAVRTGAIMRSRVLYHRVDFATGEVLHGIALIASGQRDAGILHIANGFWHEPDAVIPRTVVGLLIELAVLGPSNFLPMTRNAQRLRRRTARDAVADARLKPLFGLVAEGTQPTSIPGLEPLSWDWGAFYRAFSSNSVARHPHREGYEKAMGKLPDDPDAASLKAIYAALCGDLDKAARDLSDLARLAPNQAMVHHRLSVALYTAREFKLAHRAAAEALQISSAIPALQAWHGFTAIRNKEFGAAVDGLRLALNAGFALPSIRGLLARALEAAGDRDEALAELDAAIADSPAEQQFRFERARLHAGEERLDEAVADLELLESLDRRAPKVMLLLAECLATLGREDEARSALEAGLERNPGHDRLTERLEELEDAL